MKVPFLDLKTQYLNLKDDINSSIQNVLDTTSYILGPHVEDFEEKFAKFCNAKYCVALNSGTSALHAALLAHGIGKGDEVITVPNSFVSTTWAIDYVGAKPVFVDVDVNTQLIDVQLIKSVLNERTKAILPVHLYGQPSDIYEINQIAKNNNLIVIEDAAQAHGAMYDNNIIGSLGNTTCFSFYPGKNLGAYGEGGAVVTDDEYIYNYICQLRNHAQSRRYHHDFLGYNFRMDGIQGAVLNVKLKHLSNWIMLRNKIAMQYGEALNRIDNLRIPIVNDKVMSAFHLYVIHSPERDSLMEYLTNLEISTGFHYPVPIHLQKAYDCLGHKIGSFPNTEKNASECISLPIFPEMSEGMVEYVCKSINDFFS